MKVHARRLRREGWTNQRIGEWMGVGTTTVDYWCRGVRRPPVVRNCRLCGDAFATSRRDGTYCRGKRCAQKARATLGWRVRGL